MPSVVSDPSRTQSAWASRGQDPWGCSGSYWEGNILNEQAEPWKAALPSDLGP